MAVIARDQVASDQLVYAWPFPIGPEPIEVACGEEEVAVMCPAWMVADRLGPGRHRWRTPDPMKPTNVYFVLTAPVEVPFDMMTQFVVPTTQQPVRLRAQGSVLARCMDPALLVQQFVGLPFDNLNDGVTRSVGVSCEKLLARVLVRRVIAAATPIAVTDPSMLPSIVDELMAYNPTAGAVTGVGFVRFNQLVIQADDGGMGGGMWNAHQGWGHVADQMHQSYSTGAYQFGGDSVPHIPYQTGAHDVSGQQYAAGNFALGSNPPPTGAAEPPIETAPAPPAPPAPAPPAPTAHASTSVSSETGAVASGEIGGVVSGEIGGSRKKSVPPGEPTTPPTEAPAPKIEAPAFPQGMRVLVSAPNGTLHAAVICQNRGEYYEVEIGSTKDVIWVPKTHVIPDK